MAVTAPCSVLGYARFTQRFRQPLFCPWRWMCAYLLLASCPYQGRSECRGPGKALLTYPLCHQGLPPCQTGAVTSVLWHQALVLTCPSGSTPAARWSFSACSDLKGMSSA